MYRYVWSQYSQMNICIHTVPCHPTWYSHASSLHHNTTLYRCHTKAPKCQQFGVTLPGTKSTSCVNILPKTNIAPEKLGRAPKGDCLLQPVIFLFEFVVSFRGWVCFLRLAKIQEWWRKDSPQIGWRPKTPQNSFNSGVMNWWWFRLVQTSGLFVLVDMDNIILKHHEEMGFWIFLRIFWGEKNPQKNVVETSRVFTYNINSEKTPCPKHTLSYKHPESGQIISSNEELFPIPPNKRSMRSTRKYGSDGTYPALRLSKRAGFQQVAEGWLVYNKLLM